MNKFFIKTKGVSIIETMIVTAILVIITAVSLPAYKKYTVRNKASSILKEAVLDQANILAQYTDLGTLEGISYNSYTRNTPIQSDFISDITVTDGEITVTANADEFGGVSLELTLTPVINQSSGVIEWLCSTTPANFDIAPTECRNDVNSRPTSCFGGTTNPDDSCTCPAGQYLQSGHCKPCTNGQSWNGTACTCPTGQSLIDGQCTCSTGLWNGEACVTTCSPGQTWNGTICECPTGQTLINGACGCSSGYWDGSQCATCGSHEVWNNTTNACECGIDTVGSVGSCTCPSHKPLFINGVCVSCPGGQISNGNECACPDSNGIGTSWDSVNQTCICDSGSGDISSGCSCPMSNGIQSNWDSYSSACVCNTGGSTGNTTIGCSCPTNNGIPSSWNSGSQTCDCYGGAIGSASNCSCPTSPTGPTSSWNGSKCTCDGGSNGNPINSEDCTCPELYVWNSDNGQCEGPQLPETTEYTIDGITVRFDVKINKMYNEDYVLKNENFRVDVDWSYEVISSPCGGKCEIYYTIGFEGQTDCLFSAFIKSGSTGSGSTTVKFNAPDSDGTYYINYVGSTKGSCGSGTLPSGTTNAIGIIHIDYSLPYPQCEANSNANLYPKGSYYSVKPGSYGQSCATYGNCDCRYPNVGDKCRKSMSGSNYKIKCPEGALTSGCGQNPKCVD